MRNERTHIAGILPYERRHAPHITPVGDRAVHILYTYRSVQVARLPLMSDPNLSHCRRPGYVRVIDVLNVLEPPTDVAEGTGDHSQAQYLYTISHRTRSISTHTDSFSL